MIPPVVRVSVDGQEYQVPTNGLIRVLDLMRYIFEELNPNFAYRRHLCRDDVCMGCLININGKIRLACSTPLEPGLTEYRLAPAKTFPVIRDLVVDYLQDYRREEWR